MIRQFLNYEKMVETIERLSLRIDDRFPGAGLGGVCSRLLDLARETREINEWIHRPNYLVRSTTFFFIGLVATVAVIAGRKMSLDVESISLPFFVQLLESLINDLILIGGALFFLYSSETRVKRQRIIASVNKLRSIAHVIDMHQLTKDPSTIADGDRCATPNSPARNMTPFELCRYLDYCSEMLSLVSKAGFLYAQSFDDPVCQEAVNDLENLTNGLSRKIWQKIMILNNDMKTEAAVRR